MRNDQTAIGKLLYNYPLNLRFIKTLYQQINKYALNLL